MSKIRPFLRLYYKKQESDTITGFDYNSYKYTA